MMESRNENNRNINLPSNSELKKNNYILFLYINSRILLYIYVVAMSMCTIRESVYSISKDGPDDLKTKYLDYKCIKFVPIWNLITRINLKCVTLIFVLVIIYEQNNIIYFLSTSQEKNPHCSLHQIDDDDSPKVRIHFFLFQ